MHFKARFASVLLAMILIGAGHAPAMDILFFARMALDDQATYITNLVTGSAKILRQTGHADQAAKTIALFKDASTHGGIHQLAANIKAMQSKNTLNTTLAAPRGPTYDVEAAMQLTLRNNGIDLPLKSLETINRSFAPSLPLRPHAM